MEDLEDGIGLQAYAQKDPVNEYRRAAADMFDEMIASVREQTAKMMLMVIPTTQIKAPTAPRETGAGLKGAPTAAPVRASDSIRNSVYGRSAKPEARKEPVRKTAPKRSAATTRARAEAAKSIKNAAVPDFPTSNRTIKNKPWALG